MLSLYLGVVAGTGQALLGLTAVLAIFILSVNSLGARKALAFFGLTDLLLLLPVLLGVLLAEGTSLGAVVSFNLWRMVCYTLGVGLGVGLFAGQQVPDWLLPMRGRWARKLLALAAVSMLALAVVGDVLWAVASGGLWVFAPRWALGLAPLLFPYFWSAWDVLSRGWEPAAA